MISRDNDFMSLSLEILIIEYGCAKRHFLHISEKRINFNRNQILSFLGKITCIAQYSHVQYNYDVGRIVLILLS